MVNALYRKWRPMNWDEVVGQDHIIQTLQNAVKGDRIVHAYLFAGPRGTGKTTTARLMAKAVNCLDEDASSRPCNTCSHCLSLNEGRFLDLIEIDANKHDELIFNAVSAYFLLRWLLFTRGVRLDFAIIRGF